jgi:hypothetical protein
MRRLKALGKHPFTGGVGAILMALGEGLSLAGVFPASTSAEDQLWWLRLWFLGFFGFATWGYFAWFLRWRSMTEAKAEIVFDSRDDNHVQYGRLARPGASAGSQPVHFDEYIYALGIVGLSSQPIDGCRLVLQASTPRDTSQQRLGRAMAVRNDPEEDSDGAFTIYPGATHPSVYAEVLQEIVPRGGPESPSLIRLMYSNERRANANFFTQRDHVLTFRLEGAMAKPITYRLGVTYDDRRHRWNVEPV